MFIRFFLKNYNEIFCRNILNILKFQLEQKFPDITSFSLLSSEEYWKIPELTEIVVQFQLSNKLRVKEFVNFFDLNSVYKSSEHLDEKNNLIINENAIWDKETHGGEFLVDNIVWAQFYTMNDIK